MTEIIKVNDVVLIKTTQTYGKISAIQYERNRYQLVDVSNWQYGINYLEKQTFSSLITTIESQKEEIEKLIIDRNECLRKAGQNGKSYVDALGEIESLKAITELALKGFKEVLKDAPWETDSYTVAFKTLAEIERLSNAQT